MANCFVQCSSCQLVGCDPLRRKREWAFAFSWNKIASSFMLQTDAAMSTLSFLLPQEKKVPLARRKVFFFDHGCDSCLEMAKQHSFLLFCISFYSRKIDRQGNLPALRIFFEPLRC
ncbi:hypothetical protein AVEN_274936-1 [Araneus ventricosus]|uniref:Uncharacterized protein n=1 Tax=Araneus ventricosus TaxID=182803 RepID=A0A4Y2S1V3_ARAVE|nr:hypothetical protein AVEN_274936-1 [Araneus ventricosus]